MQVLLFLCCLAFANAQQVGEDGYTDENRPYEFGFNIEGYQHRHEMKDENGIIMGEFGFITADGIYHVTVYATDENGDFKILKMKNIRVGFPPGTPLMDMKGGSRPQSKGIAPKNAPAPTSTTNRPVSSTINPKFTVANGCGSCKIPVTTTRSPLVPPSKPPSIDVRGLFPAAAPRAETPETPGTGTPAVGQPPVGGIFGGIPGQVPGSNAYGGSPIIGQPPVTSVFGSSPNNQSSGTVPFIPSPGIGFVGTPQYNQSSGNTSFGQPPGTNFLGPSPGNVFFGNNQSSVSPVNGQIPGSNVLVSGLGGVSPSNTSTGFPSGGVPPISPPSGQFPIPSYPGAIPGGENPGFPPVPGVFGDVPTVPDSGKPGGGNVPSIGVEKPGLPNGITENDIKALLYRFNYTAGYHGHHESGYRNGDKEGGYFVNGRNGIGQQVKYLANEFGYQPNITFVELSATDTPQEETEKNAGLKGYAFEWFYRKRR